MEYDEVDVVFIGTDSYTEMIWRIDYDKRIYVKSYSRLFPFIGRWIPQFQNIPKELLEDYEDKRIFTVSENKFIEKRIRIYYYDWLTFDKYMYSGNSKMILENKSLRNERDMLYHRMLNAEDVIKTSNNRDLVKDKTKQDFDFYNKDLRSHSPVNPDSTKKKK